MFRAGKILVEGSNPLSVKFYGKFSLLFWGEGGHFEQLEGGKGYLKNRPLFIDVVGILTSLIPCCHRY